LAGIAVVASGVGMALAAPSSVHHLRTVAVHTANGRCVKTVINGINDKGQGFGTSYCGGVKAFTRSKAGTIRPYALPAQYGKATFASNISSNGILAVEGGPSAAGPLTGFLIAPNGHLTVLQAPAAGSFSTVVNGVNRHGDAVGFYCTDKKCDSRLPFIYRHRTHRFAPFTIKNRKLQLPQLSQILDDGTLVGYVFQEPKGYLRGFVRRHGHLKLIDAPGASHKLGQGTLLFNASNHGALCGETLGAHQRARGFARYHGHSQVIDLYPGAPKPKTEVFACNDHGVIGGDADKGRVRIGFLARL
jgi:hypothetical protein